MNTVKATIKEKYMISSNCIFISFERKDKKNWDYIPGQSAIMEFIVDNEIYKRKYSVCNTKLNEKLLNIAVAIVKDGKISNFLKNAPINTEITIHSFQGDFIYKPAKHCVLIATGTGISPFRSMLHNNILSCPMNKSIEVIHGARDRKSLIWQQEMLNIKKINYVACLSRETTKLENNEFRGRVTDYCMHKDMSNKDVYLCGNGQMIQDIKSFMKAKNIYTKRFFV